MAERPIPDIDSIDDIITMGETMKTLGISAKGLTTLDQMKTKVKQELNSSMMKTNWTAGKAFSVLSVARDEDDRKRKELLQFYSSTSKFLSTADDRLIRLLDKNMATDVKEALKRHQERLHVKEYVVLVAGETSAGKSSLINLILGEELLPSALLSTTSTICELRYGQERRIVAHFKTTDPETGQEKNEIPLGDPSEGKSYIEQISPFMHIKNDRGRGSPYKKIELYWPHELLEKGIVIVDSPGIGESEIMDEIVKDYLPEAFCFIYVINSTNAGGIQKDRIEKLFKDVQDVSREREGSFQCECALFVCNKWDGVPPQETDEVKQHIVKKLGRCWPNIKPSSQIIHFSTRDATAAQRLGSISGDFKFLIDNVRLMVIRTIYAKLQTHWKWLDHVLSRVIFHTRAFIHNESKNELEIFTKVQLLSRRVEQIEENHQSIIKELREQLNAKTNEIVRKLKNHLNSKPFQSSFTSWTEDDTPREQETWAATENDILKAVKNRFKEEIEQWEETNHVFSGAQEFLIQQINQKLSFVQGELQSVENVIAYGNTTDQDSVNVDSVSFSTAQKVLLAVTSPIWFPVSLVFLILGVPVLGGLAVKGKVGEKVNLRAYRKNRSGHLAEVSRDYLAEVAKEDSLRSFVEEHLKEVKEYLRQMETKIPFVIEAHKMLLLEFLIEAGVRKEAGKLYRPLNNKAMEIRGNLALFAMNETRISDIKCEELEWEENASSCLGRGAFSCVYAGKMTKNGQQKPVALKVFHDVPNAENANQFLAEENTLRKLHHPNVVEFHGTALLDHDKGTRMVFVMELCSENLRSFLRNHPEEVPGKARRSEAMKRMTIWANEIALALDYIHANGVVHRDLKSENILISKDNSMKIADVGVAKEIEDVTGTLVGTPIYIAPEVFASQVYNSKADIYSFALILWEMWYGKTVFSELLPILGGDFSQKVRSGYRPKRPLDLMPQPPDWENLITNCWDADPENRPTARECNEKLTSFSKCLNL